MNSTGGQIHFSLIDQLENRNYNLTTRCVDNLRNSDNKSIAFYVAFPQFPNASSGGGGSGGISNITSPNTTSSLGINLSIPLDNYVNITQTIPVSILFNCYATSNYNLTNLSLYITNNQNSNFPLNQTTIISGTTNSTVWILNLTNGTYTWNCLAYDDTNNSAFSINRTLTVNYIIPSINPSFVFNFLSPLNNSIYYQNPILLRLSKNKTIDCTYSFDSGTYSNIETSTETKSESWKIGQSKKLAITEDLTNSADAAMTIRNVSNKIIGGIGGELKALASGDVITSNGISHYNQYLYFLGPGTGGKSGYVKYTENNEAQTADFLYFKSGQELGRYVMEFTNYFISGIYDNLGNPSPSGTFLNDYNNKVLRIFGKDYEIVSASRNTSQNIYLTLMNGKLKDTLAEKETKTYTVGDKSYEVTLSYVDSTSAQLTVNGQQTRKLNKGDTDRLTDGTNVGISEILFQNFAGGIHGATFYIYAEKMELKDTNIFDTTSTNNLKINDMAILGAPVIIEGVDNNITVKIGRITVNMTDDDNYYVPAGGYLSQNPDLRKPQFLFTQNWDIYYAGLRQQPTEKIELTTSSDNQYALKFVDGDGNIVTLPIAKATGTGSQMVPGGGNNGNPFINVENMSIAKDNYFIVTDTTQLRGQRKTYALKYKGADKIFADSPVLRFINLGSGEIIEQPYSSGSGQGAQLLAQLHLGGASFNIYNASGITSSDFDIFVDMDESGGLTTIPNQTVNITTKFGAEIGLTNTTNPNGQPEIILSIKTPDNDREGNAIDSIETVESTDFVVNITAAFGNVQHSVLSGFTAGQDGNSINLRTPSGQSNVAYGYTAYGAFITRNTPSLSPATFIIDYPQSQRDALVYITSTFSNVVDSSSINITSEGNHNITVNCTDGIDYQTSFVNFQFFNVCIPKWQCSNFKSCEPDERQRCNQTIDLNDCFSKTGLPSDLYGGNFNEFEEGCDFDGNHLIGNASNVTNNLHNLSATIDNESVRFNDGDNPILEFNYSFSNHNLNFFNITIEKQNNSVARGTLRIKGLDLSSQNRTKTAYMDKVNGNRICILDAEIESISEISDDCSNSNETSLICDGEKRGNYTCTIQGSQYKIEGLSHSAAVEYSFTQSPPPGGPSSSGGGSGSSGGGGGVAGSICNMDWKCSDWTICINGIQTRECNFVKVPQHFQEAKCPAESNSPITSQKCEVKEESPAKPIKPAQSQSETKTSSTPTTPAKSAGLNPITGSAVARLLSNPKALRELIISFVVLVSVAVGIFGYKFVHKRKK